MLFTKNLFALTTLLLAGALQAHAHAAIVPELGVSGTPVRSDVQRPKNANPCGKTDIAANFDTSGSLQLDSDNTFTTTITNFNRGVDGSREIKTVKVDPTGTGDSFVAATMLQNGIRAPKDLSTETLKVQLPQGMTCTGGATGDKCLVSFTTAGRFGNCIVVQQSGSAGNSTDSASASDSSASDDGTDSAAASASDAATDSAASAAATDSAASVDTTATAASATAAATETSAADKKGKKAAKQAAKQAAKKERFVKVRRAAGVAAA